MKHKIKVMFWPKTKYTLCPLRFLETYHIQRGYLLKGLVTQMTYN